MGLPLDHANFGIGTLVWRFRSPHQLGRHLIMRTSEPKPHLIISIASVPLIPKFAHGIAAWSCELRNRDTSRAGAIICCRAPARRTLSVVLCALRGTSLLMQLRGQPIKTGNDAAPIL